MKHSAIVHDGSHVGLKLPRRLVRKVEIGRLSESFSCDKAVEGMRLHLYCTSDRGVVTDIVHGVLKRVSRRGVRQWAFLADRIENAKLFNTQALVRL